ncbi:hypothetical protein ACFXPZ_38590 [Streptomyces sp. NPDC059101]|uniref:hypothetical protein n=1 Tax=Streptomyces sp. NPDC059101 TaxID=3346728 RepID=UPI0036A6BF85
MHQDEVKQGELDDARLREVTDEVIAAITSPEFVAAMRAVSETPADQRLLEGSRRLTPDALRSQGVSLPEGFRISSRYFDATLPKPVEFGDEPGRAFNPVNALNEREPGMLDRLRTTDPGLFRQLTELGEEHPSSQALALGACACGGIKGTCGGAGVWK